MKNYKLHHFKQNPSFHFALNFLLFVTYILFHFRSFSVLLFSYSPPRFFYLENILYKFRHLHIPFLLMYFHEIMLGKLHYTTEYSQDILVEPISTFTNWWAFYPFFSNPCFQWILWCIYFRPYLSLFSFSSFFIFMVKPWYSNRNFVIYLNRSKNEHCGINLERRTLIFNSI